MKKINFIFGVHNHQPVGNFPEIFEQAFQKAYLPFVEVLRRHPQLKMSFHYSGALFEYINSQHPEFVGQLKEMVAAGQIEMLTGGFYEPILAILPDKDKRAQIEKLTNYVGEKTGFLARGMWLAERIWEPQLVKPLNEAGVEYVVLDDYHFKSAGLAQEDLLWYYITEEQGKSLAIFPISQELRYNIPFAVPEKTIEYCASLASVEGDRVLVIADDGEKFGIWPQTYHSVYEEGWLERFFSLLEANSSWIKTMTFSQYLNSYKPRGRVYIPCTSYSEMLEWSLPEKAQETYGKIMERIKNNSDQQEYLRFIKGGFWRNFLVKYPESNNMHKKMLEVSARVNEALQKAGTAPDQRLLAAQDELLAGQCNDSYWHGVFGGLYMGHLRHSVYGHLINAEKYLAEINPEDITKQVVDYNNDGSEEIVVTNNSLKLYIAPDSGGRIVEFDYCPKSYNLLNVLTRHKEAYHQKIIDFSSEKGQQSGDTLKTIHEQFHVKENNLDKYLKYDWYQRGFMIDHFLSDWADLVSFYNCNFGEKGDFVNQPYVYQLRLESGQFEALLTRQGHVWVDNIFANVKIEKKIRLQLESKVLEMEYTIINLENLELKIRFGSEFCFAGTTGQDDGCFYYSQKEEDKIGNKYLNSIEENLNFEFIGIKDYFSKINAYWRFSEAASIWRFPLETVSQSESGFERSYQGSVLMAHWKLKLPPKGRWHTKIFYGLDSIED